MLDVHPSLDYQLVNTQVVQINHSIAIQTQIPRLEDIVLLLFIPLLVFTAAESLAEAVLVIDYVAHEL